MSIKDSARCLRQIVDILKRKHKQGNSSVMHKGTLLLCSLWVLATAAVLRPHDDNVIEGCRFETELWGSDDGTKFYMCLPDNQAIELACEPNTFFVRNDTVSGCVPVSDVSDNCVYHQAVQPCQGEALLQPQTDVDPIKFYVCPGPGAQPLAFSCGESKAFVKQDGYLGCFPWSEWRQLRGCK